MESIERWDKSLDQWDKQTYINLYIYIYIYIRVNFITTEACSPKPWNHGLCSGNHPRNYGLACGEGAGQREDRWPYFRLMNYYNLPRVLYNFDEQHHLLEED